MSRWWLLLLVVALGSCKPNEAASKACKGANADSKTCESCCKSNGASGYKFATGSDCECLGG